MKLKLLYLLALIDCCKYNKAPVLGLSKYKMFFLLVIYWFLLVDIQKVSMTGGVKHVILLF